MHILMLLDKELDISTSQTSRFAIARALLERGNKVMVVGRYRYRRRALADGVPVMFLPRAKGKLLRAMSAAVVLWFFLPILLLRFRPDIVLVDRPVLIWPTVIWNMVGRFLGAGTKWVLDVRSPATGLVGIAGYIYRVLYVGAVKLARYVVDGMTTISEELRLELARITSVPADRIGIWSSGVDTLLFCPRNIGVPNDWPFGSEIVFLYHGVISNDRALAEVIDAISILRKRRRNVVLMLLGDGRDYLLLREFVRRRNLEDAVVFHKAVKYELVPQYIGAADFGVVPAPDDNWYHVSSPLKLLEYLALGKPVVATDIGAVRRILRGRGHVKLVSCTSGRPSAEEFAESMESAIAEFGKGFMSEENRRIVLEQYEWRVIAKNLERYFRKL